jgi:hypothetical protein
VFPTPVKVAAKAKSAVVANQQEEEQGQQNEMRNELLKRNEEKKTELFRLMHGSPLGRQIIPLLKVHDLMKNVYRTSSLLRFFVHLQVIRGRGRDMNHQVLAVATAEPRKTRRGGIRKVTRKVTRKLKRKMTTKVTRKMTRNVNRKTRQTRNVRKLARKTRQTRKARNTGIPSQTASSLRRRPSPKAWRRPRQPRKANSQKR